MNADEFFQKNLAPASFALTRAKDRLRHFQSGKSGMTTGWVSLDKYMRLSPTEYTVVGGRAGTGKTAFGMQLVYNTLQATKNLGGSLVVFSAEMDGASLMLREACAQEGVSFWDVQTRSVPDEVYDRLEARLQGMAEDTGTRLLIDESSAPTLEHMLDQLVALEERSRKIHLILFDYTELSGELDKNEPQRIAKIGRGMKAMAKRFNCPVVALSQLSRDIEGRENKTPSMRDLMYGGEREPDRILILQRPWLLDKEKPRELVVGHVVKNRNGPQGEALFKFDENRMRFSSAQVERVTIPQIMLEKG